MWAEIVWWLQLVLGKFSSVQFSLGPICLNPELFKGLDPLSQSRWK